MKPKLFKGIGFFAFCMLIVTACNYYKIISFKKDQDLPTYSSIDSLQKLKRYFVLRSGDSAFYMNDLKLNHDQTKLSCTLEPISDNHLYYLNSVSNNRKRYSKSDRLQKDIVNEVHFYTMKDIEVAKGPFSMELSQIQKIEVIQHDKRRTTNSYVIAVAGTVAGLALVGTVAAIIAIALKSSCPFVSAYDGNDFTLQGEIYGGAIYPQLTRKDYLLLKMAPQQDGSLQLKISNELKEKQYTDLARLWVIHHQKNTKVFVDEKGKLHTISQPQQPISALLNNRDVLSSVKKANDLQVVYMEDTVRKDAQNEITIRFKRPLQSKKAKLVLRMKNTYFLDLLYGELAMNMGNYYNRFVNLQKKKTATELLKWVNNQNIPLTIGVNTITGWKKQAALTTVGPLAFRESVVTLDLSDNYSDEVEVKLSSGFMFWEIDYAAIDYSENELIETEVLSPESATDELNNNVIAAVSTEDGNYLNQPEIGNVATIVYKSNRKADTSLRQTYILETKGYYEHIRNFQHEPDFAFLKQFRKAGAFPAYGLKLYKKIKIQSSNALAIAKQ